MNCEVAHERIVTAAYGELPDEQAHELEGHLGGCADCQQEREQVLALQVLAAALPVNEPDANLMARARMRLDEALDALPPRRWYERIGQRLRNGWATLQSAPVAAVLVLALGAGGGGFAGYRYAQRSASPHNGAAAIASATAGQNAQQNAQQTATQSDAALDLKNVANVLSVVRRPGGGEMVDVAYNEVVPHHVVGSLDDSSIRQLLMIGTENPTSARVRGDAVSLLASECLAGHSCRPEGIRDALIVALRYDASPAVREQALAGLEPYVAEDVRVRDAVLEALMNDTDPKIRSTSISMLAPVEADTSVRQVLNTVSTSDENPHIRYVSRQILSQVPEIQ
jgi:Putative zinc-finger